MKKLKKEFDNSIPPSPVSFNDINHKIEYSSSKKKAIISITSSLVVLTCLGLIIGYSVNDNKINDYETYVLNYVTYIIRDYYRDTNLYFNDDASVIIDKQNGNHLITLNNNSYYLTFTNSNINEYTFNFTNFDRNIEFTIQKENIKYIVNLINSKESLLFSLYQPIDNYKAKIIFDLATK